MTNQDLRFITSTSGLWCIKDMSNPKIGHKTIRKFVRINVYKDDENNYFILKVVSANNLSPIPSFGVTKISLKEYESITDDYDAYDECGTYDIPMMRAAGLFVCGTDDMEYFKR